MTRRVLIYIVIIIITLGIILYIRNPQLLKDIWMWVVGLFGVIVAYVEMLWKSLKENLFPSTAKADATSQPPSNKNKRSPLVEPRTDRSSDPVTQQAVTPMASTPAENKYRQQVSELEKKTTDQDRYIETLESKVAQFEKTVRVTEEDTFQGTTLNLLRYIDDGETTLGLLYLESNFFCYTLEDTFREIKVPEKTRIPAGTYPILFNKNLTELTKKYRAKSYTKGWFNWHLHLQNVPQFEGIYIHAGKNTGWTEGCILVSDDLYSEGKRKALLNSENAYERLYRRLTSDLDAEIPVRIRVQDEQWFKNEIQNPTIS